jgi:hypothetical protein
MTVVAMNVRALADGDPVTTGQLRLHGALITADPGARWLLEDFVAVLPHGDEPRLVTPADGEAFLFACWFSLRGTYTWGELIDASGKELTRDESLAELDAFLDAATDPIPAGAPGRSDEQQEAEAWQIAALALQLGIPLVKQPRTIGTSRMEFDGWCDSPPTMVEAWAHQGAPRPAQKNKVMTDALKLYWASRTIFSGEARLILLLSDSVAAAHFRGRSWMALALKELGVEVIVIPLPEELRNKVARAQERQKR